MKNWITREGTKIKIKDLTDSHLVNILKFIKRKADEGIGGFHCGGHSPDDFWVEECTVAGEEALEILGYDDLKKEADKRKLNC